MSAAVSIPLPKRRDYENNPLNRGVYLDRSVLSIPDGAMLDCRNVRIKNGAITNENMGWSIFGAPISGSLIQFPGSDPITLIDSFTSRAGVSVLMVGTQRHIAQWTGSVYTFLNPIVSTATGTVSASAGSPIITGSGTTFVTDGVEAGDIFYILTNNHRTVGYKTFAGWYEVDSVDSETQITLTQSGIPNLSGVGYTILKSFPTVEGDIWSAEMFPDAQPANEDRWYATNGSVIVQWNGAASEVTDVTATLGFTCKAIFFYKNMLLYGNLTEAGDTRPNSIRSSAIATPESVTPGTLESVEFVASEGVENLLRMEGLGDYVVVYCERSVNVAQFVGPSLYFAVRTAVPSIGPLGSRAVVDFGDHHRFLADDRGYYFDGVSLQEYGPHVLREALRRYDRDRAYYTNALIDEENGELHWILPLTTDASAGGGPTTAFTEHYLEQVGNSPKPFTIRDLPAPATGFWLDTGQKRFSDLSVTGQHEFNNLTFRWNDRFFSSAFPLILFGTDDGSIMQLGTANSTERTLSGLSYAISSFARFARRPSWDGRSKGLVVRVEPYASRYATATAYSLACAIWGSDFAEGDRTKLDEQLFDLTHSGRRWVSFLKACLYHEVVLSTNAVNAPWTLSGYRVTLAQGGLL